MDIDFSKGSILNFHALSLARGHEITAELGCLSLVDTKGVILKVFLPSGVATAAARAWRVHEAEREAEITAAAENAITGGMVST